ncbi:carboxypeptidase S1 [Thozetella sp. PMI_491]|nr:carboxypeptidase S1 [Thozetella sp. PMI_491]
MAMLLLLVASAVGLSLAAPACTGDHIVENSGICETTPGVKQYSGYLSVGEDMHMWFWFFAARNNPETAPLVTWLNGGPGASSMRGLFQDNGPCHFPNGSSSTEPTLNELSFNTGANMLYIDQPIGVGFSYGSGPEINSTVAAIPYLWTFLQRFISKFPEFKGRDLGIFAESYGGHYGPEFARYILEKNAAGEGERINVIALGINSGLYDYTIQEKAMIEYAYNNPYRQLINESDYEDRMNAYSTLCVPAVAQCAKTGTDDDCSNADDICYTEAEGNISERPDLDFDVYDIRSGADDPNPPTTYINYLAREDVLQAIGAETAYHASNNTIFNQFISTGDTARTSIPWLSEVARAGIPILIWVGDADWLCNYIGAQGVAESIQFHGQTSFKTKDLADFKIAGDNTVYGSYKVQDNLSYLKVFQASHNLVFSQPKPALAAFTQMLTDGKISSA